MQKQKHALISNRIAVNQQKDVCYSYRQIKNNFQMSDIKFIRETEFSPAKRNVQK